MVKYLNIGKNIGKTIYRSISSTNTVKRTPLPNQKHFLIGSTRISYVTYFDLKKGEFSPKGEGLASTKLKLKCVISLALASSK